MSGNKSEMASREAVKKLAKRENNSRKDAKAQSVAKQTKEFFFALLCVFAPLREIVHFFTASLAWALTDRPFGAQVKHFYIEPMHNNPVKRSLVAQPGDWPWSSWRFYYPGGSSILAMGRLP